MVYRNNTIAALTACENARTGHFGLDECCERKEDGDIDIPKINEKNESRRNQYRILKLCYRKKSDTAAKAV